MLLDHNHRHKVHVRLIRTGWASPETQGEQQPVFVWRCAMPWLLLPWFERPGPSMTSLEAQTL